MRNSILLIALFFSLLNLYASPLDPKNFVTPSENELKQNGTAGKDDLILNNTYLNIKPEEVDKVRKQEEKVREAFDRFSEKEINYKPVIRPIASMDSITLHPYFTFTLLLPPGSIISHIDSSMPMAVLKFENNTVLIRPNTDFKVSNMTILYNLNNTNYVLNLLASFYERDKALDKLNLVYSYRDVPKLDDLEVINAYIRENGSMPQSKYSYIQIDDISYRIVEDEKYGNIFIDNKKYRVDNNTVFK